MNCIYWSFCFSNRFHLCKVLNMILKQLFLKQLLFLLNYLKFCVVFCVCGFFPFSFFFLFYQRWCYVVFEVELPGTWMFCMQAESMY